MQFLETSTVFWLVCSLLPSASGYENAVIRGEARQQGRTRDKTYFPIHPPAAAPKVRAGGGGVVNTSQALGIGGQPCVSQHQNLPLIDVAQHGGKLHTKKNLQNGFLEKWTGQSIHLQRWRQWQVRLIHWELWCDCDFVKTLNWE